jgi:SAM-dependent methyltransferase
MPASLARALHRAMEFSFIYAVNQWLGRPTTDRFRRLIREFVGNTAGRRVLDLGCGIGNYRDLFAGEYVGIDINPDYIAYARTRFRDRFEVMDAVQLSFVGDTFDDVVTIATTHHLSDEQFVAMVKGTFEFLRPGGALHIIDAILPVSPSFVFKTFWFGMDRGRYARHIEEMTQLAARFGRVVARQILIGPLHDTAYIRVMPIAHQRGAKCGAEPGRLAESPGANA